MKKLRDLAEVLREFNGLMARTKKDPSKENQALLQQSLNRLVAEANKVLD